jgi:hypothetical protein
MLAEAHAQDRIRFFGDHAALADKRAFKRFLAPLRRREWVVYTKEPFAGPEQVLRYLSRYTHRVAISNRRLVAADANAIAFRWKDYRIDRPDRWKTMTLSPHEFIRRFLMHVLPKGFHRIRHYGLFANGNRAANVARSRELLGAMPRVVRDGDILPKNSLLTFSSNTRCTRVRANALWWCVDCTMGAASTLLSSSRTARARCCRLG